MNTLPRIPRPCQLRAIGFALLGASALSSHAAAAITTYINDEAGWLAAAGLVTTIDFVEDTSPGWIYFDHYAPVGVLLSHATPLDPTVAWWYRFDSGSPAGGSQLHDDGGLWAFSSAPPLAFRFAEAIHAFAHLPMLNDGGADVQLLREGQHIGWASLFGGPSGTHRGVYSTEVFDEVRFVNRWYIDDIYFQTIPAPGALAVLALAMPLVGRRRR